jgi:hypothetical protein
MPVTNLFFDMCGHTCDEWEEVLRVNERFSYLCNFMISQCHLMEDPNHSCMC